VCYSNFKVIGGRLGAVARVGYAVSPLVFNQKDKADYSR
jgi:hypothetical protein